MDQGGKINMGAALSAGVSGFMISPLFALKNIKQLFSVC